jgi:hypothetical protein
MEFCHTELVLHSTAAQRLLELIEKERQEWVTRNDLSSVGNFESFKQDIHTLVMAVERELVSEELSRYDLSVNEIEVEGKVYRRSVSLPESCLTAAGRISVERHLYYPVRIWNSGTQR